MKTAVGKNFMGSSGLVMITWGQELCLKWIACILKGPCALVLPLIRSLLQSSWCKSIKCCFYLEDMMDVKLLCQLRPLICTNLLIVNFMADDAISVLQQILWLIYITCLRLNFIRKVWMTRYQMKELRKPCGPSYLMGRGWIWYS